MTKFSPREGLFGNVVEIKVVGKDEISYWDTWGKFLGIYFGFMAWLHVPKITH